MRNQEHISFFYHSPKGSEMIKFVFLVGLAQAAVSWTLSFSWAKTNKETLPALHFCSESSEGWIQRRTCQPAVQLHEPSEEIVADQCSSELHRRFHRQASVVPENLHSRQQQWHELPERVRANGHRCRKAVQGWYWTLHRSKFVLWVGGSLRFRAEVSV